jgi:hypothetical protein
MTAITCEDRIPHESDFSQGALALYLVAMMAHAAEALARQITTIGSSRMIGHSLDANHAKPPRVLCVVVVTMGQLASWLCTGQPEKGPGNGIAAMQRHADGKRLGNMLYPTTTTLVVLSHALSTARRTTGPADGSPPRIST